MTSTLIKRRLWWCVYFVYWRTVSLVPLQYCLSGHPTLPCNVLKFKSTTIMLDCGLDTTSVLNFLPLPFVHRFASSSVSMILTLFIQRFDSEVFFFFVALFAQPKTLKATWLELKGRCSEFRKGRLSCDLKCSVFLWEQDPEELFSFLYFLPLRSWKNVQEEFLWIRSQNSASLRWNDHPSYSSVMTLKWFSESCGLFWPQRELLDLSNVDVILISNYHCMMALPYITEHTGFTGTVYATEPTLQIGRYGDPSHWGVVISFLFSTERKRLWGASSCLVRSRLVNVSLSLKCQRPDFRGVRNAVVCPQVVDGGVGELHGESPQSSVCHLLEE